MRASVSLLSALVAVLPSVLPGRASVAGDSYNRGLAVSESEVGQDAQRMGSEAIGGLPIVFEPNVGQASPQVRFLTRSSGVAIGFGRDRVVFSVPTDSTEVSTAIDAKNSVAQSGRASVTMHFEGARSDVSIAGARPLPGHSNYLAGSDSSKWIRNVPQLGELWYRGLYPGVDARFYSSEGHVEYDLVVAPGADVSSIGIRFEGAEGLHIDESGDALVALPGGGVLRHSRVVAFQDVVSGRKGVPAGYRADGRDRLTIDVSEFDRTRPLVLDPALQFSVFLGGGKAQDRSKAIAVDSNSAVYIAGHTEATDFPTTPGSFDTTFSTAPENEFDAFVMKLSSSGDAIEYATYLGGTKRELCTSIAVEPSGAVLVTGNTTSTDFPTTPGAFDGTPNSGSVGFVSRLSADGTTLQHSTLFGGTNNTSIEAVTLAGADPVVVGWTGGGLPVTPGAYDGTYAGDDAFVARFTSDLSQLVFSTYLGGNFGDFGRAVAIRPDGTIAVGGDTFGGFPVTGGAFDTSPGVNGEGFVSVLSANGTTLVSSTYLGGADGEFIYGLAVRPNGELVAVGSTNSTTFPVTPGAADSTSSGPNQSEGFATCLSANLSSLVYSTFLGGAESDASAAVALDSTGAAYVTGRTDSSDFPVTSGAFSTLRGGASDTFVVKIASNGTSFSYATYLGGTASSFGESGNDIVVDTSGRACVTGDTGSRDFPTLGGPGVAPPRDVLNGFVTRLTPTGGALDYSFLIGGDAGRRGTDTLTGLDIDTSGNVYLAGNADETFPTTPGAFQELGGGGFVAKLSADASTLIYATVIAGATPESLCLGSNGEVIAVGGASGAFPTTPGAFDESIDGASPDGFALQLSADGSALLYSTVFGGSGIDSAKAAVVTPDDQLVVAGHTYSANFPTTPGAFDETHNGTQAGLQDGFVLRLAGGGSTLVWSTFLGGASNDQLTALSIDASGDFYVTGITDSSDYPVTPSAFNPFYSGQSDALLTKLEADGAALVYSTFIGGGAQETGYGLAVTVDGAAVVVGKTLSADFPITPGAADAFFLNEEAFALRLDSTGSFVELSTFLGGGLQESAYDVGLDADGSIVVVGFTRSANFPTLPGALSRTLHGQTDAFVSVIASDGTRFKYSTLLGGNGSESAFAVKLDPAGAITTAGTTGSTDFATTGFGDRDDENVFVARLRPISSGPDATLALTSSPMLVGTTASYAVTVTNVGADSLAGPITVVDTLPSGLSFLGGSGVGWSFSVNGQTVTATHSSAIGSGSSSQLMIAVSVSQGAIPSVTNSATVTSATDIILTNNTASITTPVSFGSADLAVTMDESADPILSGAVLTYSIVTTNSGPDPALGVEVTTPIGSGMVFGSCVVSQGTFTSPPVGSGGLLVGSLGTIGVGQSATVTLSVTVTANAGASLSGTATVVSQSSDPNSLDNLAVESTGVVGMFAPGSDTPGINVAASAAWFLRNENSPGPADEVFGYGPAGSGWIAIRGDWDGDGDDTAGLYDAGSGAFFLKNVNGPGPADIVFTFGAGGAGYIPITGDWDGDGADTIGIYQPASGAFFLRNSTLPGPADLVLTFGPPGPGIQPVAGDWDGDGDDTVGIYHEASGTFFLRNANLPGPADTAFSYGPPFARALVGDWDNNGFDTVAVYISTSGAWFIKNTNTPGPADLVFTYGPANAYPLAGDWDNQ